VTELCSVLLKVTVLLGNLGAVVIDKIYYTVSYKIYIIGPTPNFLSMLQHFQIKVAACGAKAPIAFVK
jgi:hypothetical protein